CLMGEGSPTRLGIGDAAGASAGVRTCSSAYGDTVIAVFVNACSWARSGVATNDSEPVRSVPMYSARLGPSRRFAWLESPLPLKMKISWPSPLNMAAVGYHPVGISPSTSLLPGVAMSTMATVLLSALATSSRFSSGDRLTWFGVDPGGAWRESATEI